MSARVLFELVERMGTLVRAELRKSAAALKLQPVHLQVLAYLARCNRYSNTPAAVTSYMGITKGSASQSLLVLERKQLLKKVPDSKDRRVVHVQLTERGHAVLSSTFPPVLWQQASAGLEEARLVFAAQTLQEILSNAQQRQRYQTFGQCFTCRHFIQEGVDKFRCGLTQEALSAAESQQICHEHQFAP
ncbi:MAG: MarR family winged helix-turn-helix transcriptional regulator [Gammaproteobacteria bacterium]